jgi:hypothetical protein
MSDYKMTKEQELIQEIYDLTLQNNTARELDDAFLQGIDMAVGHLIELNLLRLHDVSKPLPKGVKIKSAETPQGFEFDQIDYDNWLESDIDDLDDFLEQELC